MTKTAALLLLLASPAFVGLSAQNPQGPGKKEGAIYDPLRAEKDLEVGMYYLKARNYDAAIERLQSAIAHRPNYARPRWFLAEAYEKKGDLGSAIQYYGEFAAIMKTGKQADKAREKVAQLTRKMDTKKNRGRCQSLRFSA
jgi:Tfp pilus assembly protein PilF